MYISEPQRGKSPQAKSPLWESTGREKGQKPPMGVDGQAAGQKPPMGVEPIFFASGGAPAASHGHTGCPQNSIGPQARYDRQRALVALNWPLFSPGVSRVARERVIHGLKPHATCSVHLLHLRMLSYPYHFNMCMCMYPPLNTAMQPLHATDDTSLSHG